MNEGVRVMFVDNVFEDIPQHAKLHTNLRRVKMAQDMSNPARFLCSIIQFILTDCLAAHAHWVKQCKCKLALNSKMHHSRD